MTWEERVRRRTDGLRQVASVMTSANSRAAFLSLADEYDGWADQLMAQLAPAAMASLPLRAGHQAASERWAGLGDQ